MKKLMILPALAVAFMTFSALMPASAHDHYWRHERWVVAHQMYNPYGAYGGIGYVAPMPAYGYGAYRPYYGGGPLHHLIRAL